MALAIKHDVPEEVRIPSTGVSLAGTLFVPQALGAAPTFLVCHGAGEFKENYYDLCQQLANSGIAALALDMRGHGQSDGERYHVSVREWVEDIQAALDFISRDPRLDPDRVGAFGMSSGGTAVLETSLVDPRVRALVVLDPTVRNSLPPVASLVVKGLNMAGSIKRLVTGSDLRLPVLRLFGPMHLVADPDIEAALHADARNLDAYMNFPFPGARDSFMVDTIERVGAITVPTLVIWGEEDQLDPVETGRLLHGALNCEKALEVIPGNGHAGHLDRNRSRVFDLTTDWGLQHLP